MNAKNVLINSVFVALLGLPGLAIAQDPPVLPPVEVPGTRPSGWTTICEGMGCAGFFDQSPIFNPIFDPVPIGGGGGGEEGETKVSEGTTVNRAKKEVNTDQINCSAEFGQPVYYASMYYIAVPNAPAGTVITLNGASGSSWRFTLLGNGRGQVKAAQLSTNCT